MDAIKYFEEKKRMLDSLGRKSGICSGVNCSDCPFYAFKRGLLCGEFEAEYPEEAVAIVEKWAEEHPQKTILQDCLEKQPTADVVEVVRCKDCEYGEIDDIDIPSQYLCHYEGYSWNDENHYCSYGKKVE